MKKIFGPFSQIITLQNLPEKGPISDSSITALNDHGIATENGIITEIAPFDDLANTPHSEVHEYVTDHVAMPGLIDSHTHICFAADRADEYAKRLSGVSYQEIAASGGGILSTVEKTRQASKNELVHYTVARADILYQQGVTTAEVKSGYALEVEQEIKMLEAIQAANQICQTELIPTCLAAHTTPKEFSHSGEYLEYLIKELFPRIEEKRLCHRMDIFIEKGAFTDVQALWYLNRAAEIGMDLTCHADQFTKGGALVAAQLEALSADHLEVIDQAGALALAKREVIATVLPGATLGLGQPFAPARMLLDTGNTVAIASDWNPGSAPMGHLLCQAALLGAAQKLTMAETLAAITTRAAGALNLYDRGTLCIGAKADIIAFPCKNWKEILYHQGQLQPTVLPT